MKIAVITLHRVRNYGSSLQTLATQMFFEENGAETEIIDYYPERYSSFGLLKRLKNKSRRLAGNPVLLLGARVMISFSYLKKKMVFDSFLRRYIHLSEKTYHTEKELKEHCPLADGYCTGSDQVWNSHWNEGIDAPLYLSFLPDGKYQFSYASSIGNAQLSESEKSEILPYLKRYRHITVRENVGVDIMEQIGIKGVKQMLDPTLLFDGERWNKMASDRFKKNRYVLTYNLHHDSKIDEYANRLAREKNLKVYNISYNWHDVIRKGILKWCPTVEEYLGLIRDAEYVVTDSFHATVFSLIFGTKFIDIFPEEASSRLRSLLSLTKTEYRGFETLPSVEAADGEIDFKEVNRILEQERVKTRCYWDMVRQEIIEEQ